MPPIPASSAVAYDSAFGGIGEVDAGAGVAGTLDELAAGRENVDLDWSAAFWEHACGPTNYQFYVYGASWQTFVDFSYNPTLVWNTAGLPAGTYQVSALAFSNSDQQGIRIISTYEI